MIRRRSTADIPVKISCSPCTSNIELTFLFSDIGGTDRWTWFVSLATTHTQYGLATDGETGPGQPPCVGSSLPLRWLPFRSYGSPIRRYTGCMPNYPGNDCSLDCTQHERLYW